MSRTGGSTRMHVSSIANVILANDSSGVPTPCDWSLDDARACFVHESGERSPYSKHDGAAYLTARELIVRATQPGRLAPRKAGQSARPQSRNARAIKLELNDAT